MSTELIARRYAAALLGAVDEQGLDAQEVLEELRPWQEWLTQDDETAQILLSPVRPVDQLQATLDKAFDAAGSSRSVRGLLTVCVAKHRLGLLGAIVDAYAALLDERHGTVRGEGVAAYPMDDELKGQITAKLGATLNQEPILTWREDPELLGGFYIRIANRVWNASLKYQLNRLGETIRKGVR